MDSKIWIKYKLYYANTLYPEWKLKTIRKQYYDRLN